MNITLDTPLAGKELAVKAENLARQCGYTITTKNRLKKVNMTAFLNALIEAEEIELDQIDHNQKNRGRSASYKITVQSNGNLLIGSTYTKQMGLKPGDEFEITLGRKYIHLQQVENDNLKENDISNKLLIKENQLLIDNDSVNQQSLEKAEIMIWEEICQKYPNQSVLIVDFETDQNFNIINGRVIANANDRDEIYDQLHLRQGKPSVIEYTGNICDEVFVPI
jgi:hypothetical protein